MPSIHSPTRRKRHSVYGLALALAAGLFYFHANLLFEMGDILPAVNAWLRADYDQSTAGKAIILGAFIVLFLTHFMEAAAWGLFFWRTGLSKTFIDGVYFAAASTTGVGYGDLVLAPPWRILGPLSSINGILMFGCSTAFLFVVLQNIWMHQI